MAEQLEDTQSLESTTVGIFRTSTVVKGGRRFSFGSLVVVGDRDGSVGIGYGKGRGVPVAIEKAQKDAKKNMFKVNLLAGTLPHQVTGRFNSSIVRLIPAAPGTGVIAGGTVRAVLEMAGVHDCLTKAYGSTNQKNLCKAVIAGLRGLRTRETIAEFRGVEIESSEVDEMLAANRRFMTEQTSSGPPVKKLSAKDADTGKGGGGKGGKGRGGRGGGRSRGRQDGEAGSQGAQGGQGGGATATAQAPTGDESQPGDSGSQQEQAPQAQAESSGDKESQS